MRIAATTTLTALATTFLVVTAPPAAAATISSAGPLTEVTTTPDLNCDVRHALDPAPEFYMEIACGTLVTVNGTLFGPAVIPAGGNATPRTSYTTVSQSAVSGSGTAGSPFTVVTTVLAGTVRVTQTDLYVVGDEHYETRVRLENTGPVTASGHLYRAGDCFLGDSDDGYGRIGTPPGSVACTEDTTATSRAIRWIPHTAGSRFYEDEFWKVWKAIGDQVAFPNSCVCGTKVDNGAGLDWAYTLAPGAAATFAHDTDFSGNRPLVTTKAADAPAIAELGSVGYTITISNPNYAPASLSTIYDDLPAWFTYVPGSTTGVTTADPTISGARHTWSAGVTIPARSSVSLTFRASAPDFPGVAVNEASGTSPTHAVTPFRGAIVVVKMVTRVEAEPAVANADTLTANALTLRAKLTNARSGAPLGGRLISFTAGTTPVCTATTDSGGVASCSAATSAAAVVAAVGYTATFAGDGLAFGSADNGPLVRAAGQDVL